MTRDEVMAEILRIRTTRISVNEGQAEIRELLDREYPELKEITVTQLCHRMGRSKDVGSVVLYADGSCTSRNTADVTKTAYNDPDEFFEDLVAEETSPEIEANSSACVNCRFYAESLLYKGTIGVCRRHAPVHLPSSTYAPAPVFPSTDRNDWCGDWEKKEGCDGNRRTIRV